MATETRIYLVTNGDKSHLVRAANKMRAINHVARAGIKAHVATQMELVELIGHGAQVTVAGESDDDQA